MLPIPFIHRPFKCVPNFGGMYACLSRAVRSWAPVAHLGTWQTFICSNKDNIKGTEHSKKENWYFLVPAQRTWMQLILGQFFLQFLPNGASYDRKINCIQIIWAKKYKFSFLLC